VLSPLTKRTDWKKIKIYSSNRKGIFRLYNSNNCNYNKDPLQAQQKDNLAKMIDINRINKFKIINN
jgi:hypothetical protein